MGKYIKKKDRPAGCTKNPSKPPIVEHKKPPVHNPTTGGAFPQPFSKLMARR